jgi:hypothetical protein
MMGVRGLTSHWAKPSLGEKDIKSRLEWPLSAEQDRFLFHCNLKKLNLLSRAYWKNPAMNADIL